MPLSPYMRDIRAKIGHDVLLQPGVAAIIFNAAGQVLLQRRSDNGEWGLPGGIMEPGEEPAETVVRERTAGISPKMWRSSRRCRPPPTRLA